MELWGEPGLGPPLPASFPEVLRMTQAWGEHVCSVRDFNLGRAHLMSLPSSPSFPYFLFLSVLLLPLWLSSFSTAHKVARGRGSRACAAWRALTQQGSTGPPLPPCPERQSAGLGACRPSARKPAFARAGLSPEVGPKPRPPV